MNSLNELCLTLKKMYEDKHIFTADNHVYVELNIKSGRFSVFHGVRIHQNLMIEGCFCGLERITLIDNDWLDRQSSCTSFEQLDRSIQQEISYYVNKFDVELKDNYEVEIDLS